MTLTISDIELANASDRQYKLTDGKGMYVLVYPNGSKYFRLDYRFGGKRKTLAFGVYPDLSLDEARAKRDMARKQIKNGRDPFFKEKNTMDIPPNIPTINAVAQFFDDELIKELEVRGFEVKKMIVDKNIHNEANKPKDDIDILFDSLQGDVDLMGDRLS